jgi:hypothetical protein
MGARSRSRVRRRAEPPAPRDPSQSWAKRAAVTIYGLGGPPRPLSRLSLVSTLKLAPSRVCRPRPPLPKDRRPMKEDTILAPRARQAALQARIAARGKGRTKHPAKAAPHPKRIVAAGAVKARKKFLAVFPKGFADETYIDWERDYKWQAHRRWQERLAEPLFAARLGRHDFAGIARDAIAIEGRTNLLFSFEKMALRDAVKSAAGAQAFAEGLYDFLHGPGTPAAHFDRWCGVLAALPRRQTRVLTWPVATVLGFIAQPQAHFYVKPNVTREAAKAYGHALDYRAQPNAATYAAMLAFAETVRRDHAILKPRDMIDLQSFIWVQGSAEYED